MQIDLTTLWRRDGRRYAAMVAAVTFVGLFASLAVTRNARFAFLLTAALVGLLALVRVPTLGLYAFVPLSFFATGFYVGPVPFRYYVLAGTFVVVGLDVLVKRGRRAPQLVSVMVGVYAAYILWVAVRALQLGSMASALDTVVGPVGSGFVAAVCIAYCLRTLRARSAFFFWLAFWVVLSAAIGALQYLGVEFARDLGLQVWNLSTHDPAAAAARTLGPGMPGIMPFTTTMGYTASFVLPLVWSVALVSKGARKTFLVLVSMVLFVGLVATLLTSAILGGVAAAGIVTLISRKRKSQGTGFPAVVLVLALLALAQGLVPRLFQERVLDRDGVARIPMVIAGVQSGIANPFGQTIDDFMTESTMLAYDLVDFQGVELVGRGLPHNNLVDVLVYFGFPGLILYLIFYILLVRALKEMWQNTLGRSSPVSRALAVGLIGAFCANFANAMVHNSGLFYGETIAWYGVGLLWAFLWHQTDAVDDRPGTTAPRAISLHVKETGDFSDAP